MTAKDAQGAASTTRRLLQPKRVSVSFTSSPSGVALTVNADTLTTPATVVSWEGYELNVVAPADAMIDGSGYAFERWQDGPTQRTRKIVTPAADQTFGAAYVPQGALATFAVAASDGDGDVESGGATYPPPAGATRYVGTTSPTVLVRRSKTRFSYIPVTVGLLRFDTSSLPDDAVITSAKLQLQVTTKSVTDARSFVAEWYSAANWPIDGADWTAGDAASAHSGTPLASIVLGTQNEFTLQNLGNVSRTGMSALRLHMSGSAVTPTGPNDLGFAAFDHATLPEPRLVVSYTAPSPGAAPSNTTPPTISGTPAVGEALTAGNGTWSGDVPMTFAYQWRRCVGTSCTDIGGSTAQSYTVTTADEGATLEVRVDATNSAGSSSATSARTSQVPGSAQTQTFAVATSGDDGDIESGSSSYPPAAGAARYVGTSSTSLLVRRSQTPYPYIPVTVGLIRFDTSSLPDNAVVSSAKLQLHATMKSSTNGRSLTCRVVPRRQLADRRNRLERYRRRDRTLRNAVLRHQRRNHERVRPRESDQRESRWLQRPSAARQRRRDDADGAERPRLRGLR